MAPITYGQVPLAAFPSRRDPIYLLLYLSHTHLANQCLLYPGRVICCATSVLGDVCLTAALDHSTEIPCLKISPNALDTLRPYRNHTSQRFFAALIVAANSVFLHLLDELVLCGGRIRSFANLVHGYCALTPTPPTRHQRLYQSAAHPNMVGVPGKSKGCSTCRRRKKGCDQKRPTCGQCSASGYLCGGYQRDLSFIIHPASKSAEKAFFLRHSNRSLNLAFTSSLDRNSIDLQCRALFWDLYLPRGIAEVHDGMLHRCNHPANWTSVLLELSQTEPALDLAFSALSISRVGRSNNDLRLVKESTKIYGRALKDLQKALYDESRMHTAEVLAACSLLGLYEIFEGGDAMNRSVGWISHAAGAARLIEVRGPHDHVDRQSHHVFLGARLPILFSAILRRKKTFLAQQEWLTVPWQSMPCKTYHDVLVDLAVNIPGLLEDFDRLRSSSAPGMHAALQDLLRSFTQLKDTLTRWEHNKKQFARPVLVFHKHREGDLYPFDREMSWDNHIFFNASLVYWAVQLVIAMAITQIELFLASLGFPRSSLYVSTASNHQHAHEYATYIAQSIPYALMPDMGALGISHIAFPLCLAYQHFTESGDHRTCAWLIKVCNDIRQQGVRLQPFDKPLEDAQQPATSFTDGLSEEALNRAATMSDVDDDGSALEKTSPPPFAIVTGGGFKSTFIYENPAKYYTESPESSA